MLSEFLLQKVDVQSLLPWAYLLQNVTAPLTAVEPAKELIATVRRVLVGICAFGLFGFVIAQSKSKLDDSLLMHPFLGWACCHVLTDAFHLFNVRQILRNVGWT